MNFKLIVFDKKAHWVEQAFSRSNRSKADMMVHIEEYADHINSGLHRVGENGVIDELTKDSRTAYVVDVFGEDFIIEIVEAEPPQESLKWVIVSAPNRLE